MDTFPTLIAPSAAAIRRAAELLATGALVAFPTETVYGLGADATSAAALAALFAAKGRPHHNPLIVHVADAEAVAAFAVLDARAEVMAATWWPGPLTLVLPRRPEGAVVPMVSAGLSTVAVRVPSHPVARALLAAAGRPIAAASANLSGAVSPTTPAHVAQGLGGRVALILAGGRCPIGLESTVLDLSGETAVLLRPGSIARDMIAALIGPVALAPGRAADADAPARAPGQLASHYAPVLPVRLGAMVVEADEALLAFGPDFLVQGGALRLNLSPEGNLDEAAANLYAMLRALDQPEGQAGAGTVVRGIAVMPVPETGIGIAINDRLRRAAAPRS